MQKFFTTEAAALNYLAHIFLSGPDGRMQLGNFVADAVKGSACTAYPASIADGILLHRAIDAYTDRHPAVKATVQSLKPHFGRYSGVLLDIYFDYLLASRFDEFSSVPLRRFAGRFYITLIRNRRHLPGRFKRFMWHFICTDRLGKYGSLGGIADSLGIMVRVGRIDIVVEKALGYLAEHETELWDVFLPFFRELQARCEGYARAADRTAYLRDSFSASGT